MFWLTVQAIRWGLPIILILVIAFFLIKALGG